MPTAHRHPLAAVLRSLGSLLPSRPGRRHPDNRIVNPWRGDAERTYPSVGITPSRLLAILHAADGGSPHQQFELFDDMLQKWPRLAAVEATRRLALTGLDWEITGETPVRHDHASDGDTPTPQRPDRRDTRAGDVADFCRDAISRLDTFREVLAHLATAVGYGVAVAELVWDRGELVDLVPVPHTRLLADPHQPWRLRVRTEDDPTLGVPLDAHPHKWIVHKPRGTPGRHFDRGLLRASALLYLAQNLSFKDWLIFSQIAGMPVRVAQFEPGIPDDDKRELLSMLESLGTDAVAAFSKNIDLKFVEAARSGDRPYQPLQDYCNTEITILWLGQHLTTDIKNSGSRAAAEVHDRVREDLLVDDIADEGHTIRRDLLTPMVWSKFGSDAPVPQFRRALVQSVDTKKLADTLAVAVNELGLRVSHRWVHRALGIPEPQGDESVLPGDTPA